MERGLLFPLVGKNSYFKRCWVKMPKVAQPMRRGTGFRAPVQLPSDPCSVHPPCLSSRKLKQSKSRNCEVVGPPSGPELERKILSLIAHGGANPRNIALSEGQLGERLGGANISPFITPSSKCFLRCSGPSVEWVRLQRWELQLSHFYKCQQCCCHCFIAEQKKTNKTSSTLKLIMAYGVTKHLKYHTPSLFNFHRKSMRKPLVHPFYRREGKSQVIIQRLTGTADTAAARGCTSCTSPVGITSIPATGVSWIRQ